MSSCRGASLVLFLFLAGTASAQEPPASISLTGWVVDATSRQPLPSAYVVVEEAATRMVTGEGGAFRLRVPGADTYALRIGRFGYLEMRFEIGEAEIGELMAGEQLILPLEPEPIALEGIEITVDRLAELVEQLDRRTRAYTRAVRTIGPERIGRTGPGTAFDLVIQQTWGGLFECWNSPGELCSRSRRLATLRDPGGSGEKQVLICLDDRRLWGGTAELQAIPKEEVYRLELYGFGGRDHIRLYTRSFMARAASGHTNPLPWGYFGC